MRGSRLLNIFLVVFIDLLGFGIVLPLLPREWSRGGADLDAAGHGCSGSATPFDLGIV